MHDAHWVVRGSRISNWEVQIEKKYCRPKHDPNMTAINVRVNTEH